jgi:hypothetical protein
MKSVSLSQVVRSHDSYRLFCPIQSWSQLLSLALALTAGLACISLLFMAIDPSAPVGYVVAPVLLGGLAPVFAALPGQFEVVTRFHAHHFLKTLDETIMTMGYAPTAPAADRTLRYSRTTGLFRWKENVIALSVTEHAITVSGPMFALRVLQQKLTG